jgi:hypothetical protein
MTPFDLKLPSTAKRLVTRHGIAGVFSKPSTPNYDPTTGRTDDSVALTYLVTMIPPYNYTVDRINGTTVLKTDLCTIIAALDLGFVPTTNMLISAVNEVYRIISIETYRTGELIAAYELQLRK